MKIRVSVVFKKILYLVACEYFFVFNAVIDIIALVFPFIFNQTGRILLDTMKPYHGINFPDKRLPWAAYLNNTKLFKALMLSRYL